MNFFIFFLALTMEKIIISIDSWVYLVVLLKPAMVQKSGKKSVPEWHICKSGKDFKCVLSACFFL